jgi:pimeloyl-ACP methyl ester carboxylesterase
LKTTPIDLAPFRHIYPFASRYADASGFRMHYIDEGRGEPVIMLHGNPTWSFYFRELIQGLSGRYRAVAPDHIGCGLSDKPRSCAYAYRLKNRVDDLETLLVHLGLTRDITLVLHDWGGMIGAAYALRDVRRIARLIVLNTAAFLKPAGKPLPLALRLIRRTQLFAVPAVLGLNLFARGAARMASARGLDPVVRKGLLAPYNSWDNRRATLKFVQDIPLTPRDASFAIAQQVHDGLHRLADKPMLICWGEKDFVFDTDYLAEWQRRFPAAEVHRFPEAGHYVLEDAAKPVTDRVLDFLNRHPLP